MYTIWKEEGVRNGICKGLEASMLREATYSTMRLGLYEPIKHLMNADDPKTTPMWKKFAAGAAAGAIGQTIANPCDLIKVRM